MTLSMSKWFVGSSKSNNSAGHMSARAKAKRLRQPPEKSLTRLAVSASLKPKPFKMILA